MLSKFLKLLLPKNNDESMLADFETLYEAELEKKGRVYALGWLAAQIIRSLPGLASAYLYRRGIMIRNYLKISLRNFRKQKIYYLINVSGLAVGMASCMLIFLFIHDELSYDKYHDDADRIYRVTMAELINGSYYHYAGVPYGAVQAFEEQLPEIISTARVGFGSGVVSLNEKNHEVSGILYTDSTFFEIFTYDFIKGNPVSALDEPGSIVLTESHADMLFGSEDPMGKMINLNTDGDLLVKGVIRDVPDNSHFSFNIVLNNSGLRKRREGSFNSWKGIIGWAYILVEKGTDPEELNGKFKSIENTHFDRGSDDQGDPDTYSSINKDNQLVTGYRLQKLTDIHLRSDLQYEINANSDINNIYIFSVTAMFILFIACVNFVNLSTAKSVERGREVGLRKVFGAYRGSLVSQFLSESVLLSFIGMIFGLILLVFSIPMFNSIAGKNFALADLNSLDFWIALLSFIVITGLVAGSYPAFFLSAFKPHSVLKSTSSRSFGRSGFRKYLVILQFTISIFLIVSTFIVIDQLNYMKDVKLGFDKELILVVPMRGTAIKQNYTVFKEELVQNNNIISASYSSDIPGRGIDVLLFTAEGKNRGELFNIYYFSTDHDFIETYGIDLFQGRDFSKEFPSDRGTYLVNETGAELLDWGVDAIGKKIYMKGRYEGKITGIIRDMNFRSLRESIQPFVIKLEPEIGRQRGYLSLKIKGDELQDTIEYVKSKWQDFDKNRDFDYFFIDDYLNSLYRSEEKFGRIISIFTSIAIFIACLGLFGLISFTAERRTREIGIRKTMGASVPGIVILITKEFSRLVIFANIIALPLASYIMKKYWLQDFAYRTDPGIILFITAGSIALLIALATVSYQSLKAAGTNPVDALRYE
ncbi:MAG: FtsX-like permease family protein [bacterium]|nr:FtsX-like permease family protein [bacterium]